MRQKTCKFSECKKKFTPERNFQAVCSIPCAIGVSRESAQKSREKERKKKNAVIRESLKTRSAWLKEAQAAFNAYIRERDKDLPCISCGATNSKWDAGHFYSVGGFTHIRFNEDNCHKQCFSCNSPKSGNIHHYEPALIKKIGLDRFKALKKEAFQGEARYRTEDAKRIKKAYKDKLKEIKSTHQGL